MSRVFQASMSLMAAASKSASSSSSASAASAKPLSGILKPQQVSPAMGKFVGVRSISRVDVIKRIWDHIKLHQLQNPANKKEILCDDKLKTIFDGKAKVGMMEISKLISPHFIK